MTNKSSSTYCLAWKWLPTLKLVIVGMRALVFFLVLTKVETYMGSVNLLAFWSYVVISGIILSFGSTDALLAVTDTTLVIIRKVIGLMLVTLLIFSMTMSFSEPFLIAFCSIAFGSNHWILGDLRRYSFFCYEVFSVFIMLAVWMIYLILLQYETENFSVLTSVMIGVSFCLLLITSYVRHAVGFAVNQLCESPRNIAIAKIMWETAYASVTRFPFLYLQTHNIPQIIPYVYYFAELISVAFGHLQSVFMSPKKATDNYKRRKIFIIFSILFISVYLLFSVNLILASGLDLQWMMIFLDKFNVKIESDLLEFNYAAKRDVLSFIFLMAAMQFLAFSRYGLRLFDNLLFSGIAIIVAFVFGSLMFISDIIGIENSLFGGVALLFLLVILSTISYRLSKWDSDG